jgi:hypothetical protein
VESLSIFVMRLADGASASQSDYVILRVHIPSLPVLTPARLTLLFSRLWSTQHSAFSSQWKRGAGPGLLAVGTTTKSAAPRFAMFEAWAFLLPAS